MTGAILQGLTDLMNPSTLLLLILGVVSGLIIAVIPGIGSISMLGVVVPFTFTMEPSMAFAMIVGFLAVACTSDSIPAILLGVPGSASSQATILDGYAMSRKGEAARALGASFTASVLGGIFGALVLSLTIPVIRPFVLMFGAPEFLMLALWGISMVAVLSGNTPLKGLVVGGIGLLLGSLGQDPNMGYARWTFHNAYFLEGLSIAIIGLGIFALPELISLAIRRETISRVATKQSGLLKGQMEGVKDVFKHPGLVLRSSGLGTLIGAIPGIGSAVVDWLAYGLTVQTAKDKSNFGKGDVRGVIGVDGANNAVYGGSMIPTLAFGIPGSASMAFLLIVLWSHGVPTGSNLLTNVNNLSLVYFLVWGLAIANIIGALICFFASGVLVKITSVPYYYLFAMLVPVLFIGAYYNKNNIVDLYVLIALTLLGYAFKQFGWPRAPLFIGVVLSKSVEANLNISMSVFGYSWIQRPIVLIILGIIVVSLFFSVRSMMKRNKARSQVAAADSGDGAEAALTGNQLAAIRKYRLGSMLFTGLLLIIMIAAMAQALEWPKQAARLPLIVGSIVIALLIIQLVRDLRNQQQKAAGGVHFDLPPDVLDIPGAVLRRFLQSIAWIAGLLAGVLLIGLQIALPVFAFAYMKFAGKAKYRISIPLTIALAVVLYLFGDTAGIRWYTGLLLR